MKNMADVKMELAHDPTDARAEQQQSSSLEDELDEQELTEEPPL